MIQTIISRSFIIFYRLKAVPKIIEKSPSKASFSPFWNIFKENEGNIPKTMI